MHPSAVLIPQHNEITIKAVTFPGRPLPRKARANPTIFPLTSLVLSSEAAVIDYLFLSLTWIQLYDKWVGSSGSGRRWWADEGTSYLFRRPNILPVGRHHGGGLRGPPMTAGYIESWNTELILHIR